jgi:hypothetical protein
MVHTRFQEIGHAWGTVQKHFEDPAWSEGQSETGTDFAFYNTFFGEDDDYLSPYEDATLFFRCVWDVARLSNKD